MLLSRITFQIKETHRARWQSDGFVQMQPSKFPFIGGGVPKHQFIAAVEKHPVTTHLCVHCIPMNIVGAV